MLNLLLDHLGVRLEERDVANHILHHVLEPVLLVRLHHLHDVRLHDECSLLFYPRLFFLLLLGLARTCLLSGLFGNEVVLDRLRLVAHVDADGFVRLGKVWLLDRLLEDHDFRVAQLHHGTVERIIWHTGLLADLSDGQ